MSDILENFQKRLVKTNDDELKAMGSINIEQYQDEVADLIRHELEKRQLSDDVQMVIFDHFVNGDGFAGRLILLEEQLIFLSTGMKAIKGVTSTDTGVRGGLVGSVRDADKAQQVTISKRLNFDALDNAGSWLCYLDEILACGAESKWLSGKCLTVEFAIEGAAPTVCKVRCDDLADSDLFDLKKKIDGAKQEFIGKK